MRHIDAVVRLRPDELEALDNRSYRDRARKPRRSKKPTDDGA
jgi:hypothetical protein